MPLGIILWNQNYPRQQRKRYSLHGLGLVKEVLLHGARLHDLDGDGRLVSPHGLIHRLWGGEVYVSRVLRGDVKIPTYKPYTNHKKPSVSSHTLAPTSICDLSHSVCGSPLTDLGHKLSHLPLSSFVVCLWSQKGNFDVSPYQFLEINLRPFLRRFKTNFSGI